MEAQTLRFRSQKLGMTLRILFAACQLELTAAMRVVSKMIAPMVSISILWIHCTLVMAFLPAREWYTHHRIAIQLWLS